MGRTNTKKAKKGVTLTYVAPPTAVAFHKSDAFVRVMLGPVGSGKSVSSAIELFILACSQQPNNDGVRQTRSLVTRSTYPALKTTTVRTFEDWFGGLWTITYDSPIRAKMELPLPDGTQVEWEILFYSIDGSAESLQRLRSLEITNAFINEGANTSSDVLSVIKSRVGRFPAKKNGTGATRPCILMDSNFGTTKSPLKQLVEEAPKGHAFFIQPPAVYFDAQTQEWVLNPQAENLQWLPDNYYERQLSGMNQQQIKMLLANQWAIPNQGKPIYPEFSQENKFTGYLQHIPNSTIVVGMDFGLSPACAFTQLTATGTAIVIYELWEDDMDLDTFIETRLQPTVAKRFPNSPIVICGDPAGRSRSGLSSRTAFSTLQDAGFKAVPAMSNDLDYRIGNVKYFLHRKNGLVVSTECTRLVEGFEGAYGYARLTATEESADIQFKDKPEKNEYSHIHDALQYAASYLRYGRYATKVPEGWHVSARYAARLRASSRIKGVNPEMYMALPVVQDVDHWGAPPPQQQRVQQQPDIYEYI